MSSLIAYKSISLDHTHNLKFFLDQHSTKEGTWGRLTITSGCLHFHFLDGNNHILSTQTIDTAQPSILIPPASLHRIEPLTPEYGFTLEFLCLPHRYISKKYQLSNVHSDLLYAWQTYIQPETPLNILDIGCGKGRNLLYLAQLGHQVTGVDIQASSLENIQQIATKESMAMVNLFEHDLNLGLPSMNDQKYDLVISTVSLQFLAADRVYLLLGELQKVTRAKGYHILVFPIECEPFTLPKSFTFLPQKNEIYQYYQNIGWSVLEYKESHGRLHRLDDSGKPIQGLFGFIVAQKSISN